MYSSVPSSSLTTIPFKLALIRSLAPPINRGRKRMLTFLFISLFVDYASPLPSPNGSGWSIHSDSSHYNRIQGLHITHLHTRSTHIHFFFGSLFPLRKTKVSRPWRTFIYSVTSLAKLAQTANSVKFKSILKEICGPIQRQQAAIIVTPPREFHTAKHTLYSQEVDLIEYFKKEVMAWITGSKRQDNLVSFLPGLKFMTSLNKPTTILACSQF